MSISGESATSSSDSNGSTKGLISYGFENRSCLCPGAQENHGTPEQRTACAPDAFRLCGSYIPDALRVEDCLRQRTADLSDACRSVFQDAEEAVSTSQRS